MMREINNLILNEASTLDYIVKADAPQLINEVKSHAQMVIWSGASDRTIFGDCRVNYAFRALHDRMHKISDLGFTAEQEIELGRLQASKYSGLMADLVYIEVSKQAEYYLNNGIFVADQIAFTNLELAKLGYKIT